jgi:uncharacterized protein YndB with AHSA1/START domain
MQPVSCNNDEATTIERQMQLDASAQEVWDALPAMFEDDHDRVSVIDEIELGRRVAFWWTSTVDDGPASYVEIELAPSAVGTLIRVRETRLDGAQLERSVRNARAYA